MSREVEPLILRVIEARNLKHDADEPTLPDAYVKVKLKKFFSDSKRSKSAKDTLNPFWDTTFKIYPKKADDIVSIKVYDEESTLKDDYLGEVEFPVSNYYNKGHVEEWRPITSRKGQMGELHFTVDYGKMAMVPTAEHGVSQQPQQVAHPPQAPVVAPIVGGAMGEREEEVISKPIAFPQRGINLGERLPLHECFPPIPEGYRLSKETLVQRRILEPLSGGLPKTQEVEYVRDIPYHEMYGSGMGSGMKQVQQPYVQPGYIPSEVPLQSAQR